MRKSLAINNSQVSATGLATVSRPSTSMVGGGGGGLVVVCCYILYGFPLTEFFTKSGPLLWYPVGFRGSGVA
jgi:hypothetical protein